MGFRSDIEGLRGIAVALVVLAHAGLPGAAGGFIGVDVFFVISGFLITSILARELGRRGTIDYWAFYARRAKRLVPALLLVLPVVGILAAAVMPLTSLSMQARTGMLAAAWISNIHFAFQQQDYFAPEASSSLYLHTWSLGVEEQFYLIWPLLLALIWKSRCVPALVAAVVASSLLGALIAHAHNAVAAYYLMPTRLWELALGGLVALMAERGRWLSLGVWAEALRAAGMGLMLTGVLTIRPGADHLFLWLLLPTCGAALVLFARGDEMGTIFRLFASPPLCFLGRISYALYLWHWPLLGLARTEFGDRPAAMVIAVALALVCAWLSTAYWEEPVRRWKETGRNAYVALGLVISLVLVVGHQVWSTAVDQHLSARRQVLAAEVKQHFSGPGLYKLGCDRTFKSAELFPCVIVSPERPVRRVLLLGDSVAAQWTPALEEIGQRGGWYVETLTKAGCPMVDIRFRYERIGREYVECEHWRNRVVEYLRRTRFDTVVISATSRYVFTPEQWESGTRSFLARIRGAAPDIVLLEPTPILPFEPLACLIALDELDKHSLDRCAVPQERARNIAAVSALRRAVRTFCDVRSVSVDALACPGGRCAVMHEGLLVYNDAVHLSIPYVRRSAGEFERILQPNNPVVCSPLRP